MTKRLSKRFFVTGKGGRRLKGGNEFKDLSSARKFARTKKTSKITSVSFKQAPRKPKKLHFFG